MYKTGDAIIINGGLNIKNQLRFLKLTDNIHVYRLKVVIHFRSNTCKLLKAVIGVA